MPLMSVKMRQLQTITDIVNNINDQILQDFSIFWIKFFPGFHKSDRPDISAKVGDISLCVKIILS